jgi:hypothetical protein
MKASPTEASAPSQRDTLSALLHDVTTSPNQGAHALAKSALAQALKVVEQYDLSAAITITDWLTASVAPLSGEPINLVVGTPCVFGAGCVHQGGA